MGGKEPKIEVSQDGIPREDKRKCSQMMLCEYSSFPYVTRTDFEVVCQNLKASF